MAVAGGSWIATVNHRTNPNAFASLTNQSSRALLFLFSSSYKSHSYIRVYSSSCSSPVLVEEENRYGNLPKIGTAHNNEDSRAALELGPDELNRVLYGLVRDPESRKLAFGYYEKAKENAEFRPWTVNAKYLMKCLVNSKNWESVISFCEDLRAYNAFPDGYTCCKMIGSCIRDRKFRVANHLLSVFESDRSLAVSAFDSVMKGYNKLQMYSSTISTFERMRSTRIEPSSGCYCRIMEAYERIGDADNVVELFQELKSKSLNSFGADAGPIYLILCSSLAKSGRTYETMKYFHEMKAKEIPVSSALYSSLIRSFAIAREVTIVEEFFEEAEKKKMVADPEMCLKVVLMYVHEREMEKTLYIVAKMRQAKLKVTDCVMCAILNGFSKQRGYGSAVRVYETLIEEECEPGQVTYALIINAYCRLELYDKAEMLFEEMVQKGFDRCVVAYSSMVDMYGKTRRINSAMKLVAKMKQKGCKPNIWIYNSLINMHGRAKDVRRVEKIWKEMKRMKIIGDKVTYTSMISAYNNVKEFEKCIEIYQEFRMKGGAIDKAMAGIMVSVFSKTSRVDELMRLLQDMKVQGTKLDGRLYSSALNALLDAGLQEQIRWLQEIFKATQAGSDGSD